MDKSKQTKMHEEFPKQTEVRRKVIKLWYVECRVL